MGAQIITFPRLAASVPGLQEARPRFGEWLTDQVGGKWCVRKVRTKNWRGLEVGYIVQLLPREYDAHRARYEAIYGPAYA